MASILIIESHPILREALRQFLFPEHRTVVREDWSVPTGLEGYDLVIVDRESVEEGGGAGELLRALQRLKIPSVWLHKGPPPSLKPARLTAAVAKPLEGPALDAAMRSLLENTSPSGTRRPATAEPPGDDAPADEVSGAEPADGEIIELTEVVEEPGTEEPSGSM